MKDDIIDNQQVRLIVARAWLAGMIDADGCVSFLTKKQKGYKSITPLVDISTICLTTKNVLSRTLQYLQIPFWVSRQWGKSGNFTIRVLGYRRLVKYLPQVIPYMVTKKEEAENCLKFCKLRLDRLEKKFQAKPYTQEEFQLIESIKKAKTIRNLRDYMPDILWLQDKDIVRSHDESMRE